MNRDLRSQPYLAEQAGQVIARRPLIGVTMGREKSQRFFGLSLYIMNQTYVRTLENLGALPVMIPLNMTEHTLRGIFERLDGLFLPGGEDIDPVHYGKERHPLLGATDKERDRTELALTRWAIEAGMPVLGVCRGVQMINVACGGTLTQDLHSDAPDLEKHDYFPPSFERYRISHRIDIEADSRLAHAMGQIHEVNSMHHQGIADLGYGLRVVARADDGLPEALEAPALPFVVGVQWHPEELAKTDQMSANLVYDFVYTAAGDWRNQVPDEWSHQFRQVCMQLPAAGDDPVALPTHPNGNGQHLPQLIGNCG
ncbi:MAG: gamma-glutamyl-gamma-aminobutyrate hydrolase family protein [Anaerolineales bacterium]|nr:gamma-glutamyl-gamma-aminobutyrate hydrolase family protein [Anaerolineales bacterium]